VKNAFLRQAQVSEARPKKLQTSSLCSFVQDGLRITPDYFISTGEIAITFHKAVFLQQVATARNRGLASFTVEDYAIS